MSVFMKTLGLFGIFALNQSGFVAGVKINGIAETCGLNINRMEKGSNDYGQVIGSGHLYKDSTFPASESSLFWSQHFNPNSTCLIEEYKTQVAMWKRPQSVHDTDNATLWGSNGISPMAAKQGDVNDGWLLSAAAAIAEYPARIQNIFTNQEYSAEGIYELTFYVKGLPVKVVIDDRLPMDANQEPLNARETEKDAIWLILLEKAFAKLNVNYANLQDGMVQEALKMLTGLPVLTYQTKSKTDIELHNRIAYGSEQNYTMVALCSKSQYGLVKGKIYTIISAIAINDDGKILTKLVKMRIPIGNEEYTGPWNSNDRQWTNDFKTQSKYTKESDRFFFIPVTEFKDTFEEFSAAWGSKDSLSQLTEKSSGKKFEYSINNPSTQDIVISVDYITKRMYPYGCQRPEVRYNIFLQDDKDNTIQQAKVSSEYSYGYINVHNLPAGTYNIKVINFANPKEENEFTLGVFSKINVQFLDRTQLLQYDLNEARNNTPYDIYNKTGDDKKIRSESFLNPNTHKLSVHITKIVPQDIRVTIQVQCLGGFPWGTQSNVDWKDGVNASEMSQTRGGETEKFYQMEVDCPMAQNQCYYQIPKATKFINIMFEK